MSQMRVASSITAVHIHTEPRKNVHNEKCLLLRQMCVHCKHAIRHVLKRADDKLMYTYYKPKYVHMCNVCPGLELCVIITLLHKNMSSLPPSSPETPCIPCGLLHDAWRRIIPLWSGLKVKEQLSFSLFGCLHMITGWVLLGQSSAQFECVII